jgi:arylsulfatase A-like enzyme
MHHRTTCSLVMLLLVTLGAFVAADVTAEAAAKQPNFIIIFTDDQGYQDLGCFGSPDIETPAIDRMAEEGVRMTSFYAGAPVCSPSRAALMTGCYPPRVSVGPHVFFPRSEDGLHPDEQTIAEVLKPAGYATACIGKWHLGHLPPLLPTYQGFDDYFGIPYSNDMWSDIRFKLADDVVFREDVTRETLGKHVPHRHWVPLLRGEEVIEYPADQTTLTKRYTEETIRFIEQHKDEPFFVYLPHTMPHIPLFVTERFHDSSEQGPYGDVIQEIDWSTGQILDALRRMKLDDNTLVVFTSDNGPWLQYGKRGGCALPLRAGKGTVYEGGVRVPCVAWWPGKIPAGTVCDEMASVIDLLPTLAALAGPKAQVPDDRVIDGKNIWPLLSRPTEAKTPHETLFFRRTNGAFAAVRAGKWKFYSFPAGKKSTGPQLYNLQEDISERNNLAAEHPEIVQRMQKLLEQHQNDLRKNSRPRGKIQVKSEE